MCRLWSCDSVWTNHGGAVVVIFVCWFPRFQTPPAESVVTLGTGHTEDRGAQPSSSSSSSSSLSSSSPPLLLPLLLLSSSSSPGISGVYVLQTAFVLLDLSLAARAAFGDQLGEVFALSLHTHPFIVSSIIHPLRHVAAAGWVVGLEVGGAVTVLVQYKRIRSASTELLWTTWGDTKRL